jgi:hypothetical protein
MTQSGHERLKISAVQTTLNHYGAMALGPTVHEIQNVQQTPRNVLTYWDSQHRFSPLREINRDNVN